MSKSRSFASLALGAAALGFAASPASAAVFPAIGNASGPFAIITITDGATLVRSARRSAPALAKPMIPAMMTSITGS